MTATPTYTPTYTDTPTYTATPTHTPSPTVTPTPIPYPYILTINAYNSAGELVKVITSSPVSAEFTTAYMLVSGTAVNLFDPSDGALDINVPGLNGPGQETGAAMNFAWNGTTNANQEVAPGNYYIKISTTDAYGHVNTKVESIQILYIQEYVMLNIFNSAGELVRNIKMPYNGSSVISLGVDDVVQVGKDMSNINIQYAPGNNIVWDGKNDQGEIVSSGTYEMQVVVQTGQGTTIMASKSVVVLNAAVSGIISDIKILPNPVVVSGDSTTKKSIFRWSASGNGTAVIKIFNQAGELVRVINSTIAVGVSGISWDLKTTGGSDAASGIYICVIRVQQDTGEAETKIVKMAVVNKTAPGN
jgi:flagellar hook assembly protein FlgD